jgi:UDP-N-acetylglucosamine--N-acetylmuramyl-(pentapeptide) pyrophosphoryl-undecaprenol N-acetylglucosamine transferase
MATFIMAGGGTGGHVIPGLAVARELRSRGHRVVFIGTQRGMEARLVPAENFPIEWIEIGGLKRVGLRKTFGTLSALPLSVWRAGRIIGREKPAAVFSTGGYVAGPVLLAALRRFLPVVVMEPNAVPGFTHRRFSRFITRALVSFSETAQWFPAGRTEVTGMPVRAEFFSVQPKPRGGEFTVLITGGSQGSRTLNRAASESWGAFRMIHQTGAAAFEELAPNFEASGATGEIRAFIDDMPRAYEQADLVVSRAGMSTVSELAAAGKPSILVPLPTASDQHQLRNAEAFEKAGAARLVLDAEMNGARLVEEVKRLQTDARRLESMGQAARAFAKPDAARRAAQILEGLA